MTTAEESNEDEVVTAAVQPRWFVATRPRPEAPVALFCLPYAGAGASAFRAWPTAFGPDVDVAALALPGRESRFTEPAVVEVPAVAAAIAGRAGARPYALYGHSMGARLAIDVTRQLVAWGERLPVRLFVGGSRPAHVPDPLSGLSRASDEELLDRLVGFGGIADDVLAVPELWELLLPVIRADFTWLDATQGQHGPPVPVPIHAYAGLDDPLASPATMVHWLGESTAGYELRTEPGDHFFLHTGLPALVASIEAELRVALGGARPPLDPPDDDEVHAWLSRASGARATDRYRVPGLPVVTAERDGVRLTAVGAPGHEVWAGLGDDEPDAGWDVLRLPVGANIAARRPGWRLRLSTVEWF